MIRFNVIGFLMIAAVLVLSLYFVAKESGWRVALFTVAVASFAAMWIYLGLWLAYK